MNNINNNNLVPTNLPEDALQNIILILLNRKNKVETDIAHKGRTVRNLMQLNLNLQRDASQNALYITKLHQHHDHVLAVNQQKETLILKVKQFFDEYFDCVCHNDDSLVYFMEFLLQKKDSVIP